MFFILFYKIEKILTTQNFCRINYYYNTIYVVILCHYLYSSIYLYCLHCITEIIIKSAQLYFFQKPKFV